MSFDNIFTPEIKEYYTNNKHMITSSLLKSIREHNKQMAVDILELPKDEEGFYLDSFGKQISYKRIPNLKNISRKLSLFPIHAIEIEKCSKDIFYFMENYVKIKTKSGIDFPELRHYQREFLKTIIEPENESIVGLLPRQSGKSITVSIYLCWLAIFHKDANIGIAAQKISMAKEFLIKIKDIFTLLPIWLTPGVKAWNELSISLENGIRILIDTASSDAFRGHTITYMVCDEAAYIKGKDNGMTRFSAFLDSVLPSQSALAEKKNIFISTANGLNEFATMYKGALKDGLEEKTEIVKANESIYGLTIKHIFDTNKLDRNPRIKEITKITDNQFKVTYDKLKPGANGSISFTSDWKLVPRWNIDGTRKDPEKFREEIIAAKGEVFFNQAYACIGGNTKVKYYDTKTKKYFNETIRVLKRKILKNIKQSRYLIETPDGYKSFDNIRLHKSESLKITLKKIKTIDLENLEFLEDLETAQEYIIVSKNHIFGNKIKANDLKIDDIIDSYIVTEIEDIGLQNVYSPLEVQGHIYIANDLSHHNCDFIGSSYTLLDVNKLSAIDPSPVIETIAGKLKIYKEYQEGHKYICSVDPAKDGIDGFVVMFMDITNLKMEQVAVANLDIDYLLMPEYLSQWCKLYHDPFLIIENNEGAGQSVADQMKITYEYDNLYYDTNINIKNNIKARKKYPGFRTTPKSRKQILQTLKTFFDNGNLILNDAETISQFYTFILINEKYQADDGCFDDCVMGVALSFAIFINTKNFSDMKEVVKSLKTESEKIDVSNLIMIGSFDSEPEIIEHKGITYEGFDDVIIYNDNEYEVSEFG